MSETQLDIKKTHFQILVRGQALEPTNCAPYEFKTLQEALDMVCMCYGLESLGKDIEIIEVNPYLKNKFFYVR
jgi:hypothetical protein